MIIPLFHIWSPGRRCKDISIGQYTQGLQVHGQLFISQQNTAESDSATDGVSSEGPLSFLLPCQQPPTPLSLLDSAPPLRGNQD